MQAHSEAARTALAVLKQCKSIAADQALSIERSIVTLDRELDDANTQIANTLSMADAFVPEILPKQYGVKRRLYTQAERNLLEGLFAAKGKCVRSEALELLMPAVNGRDRTYDRLVEVRVCRVRRALSLARAELIAAGLPSYINTHWREGYSLDHKPAPTAALSQFKRGQGPAPEAA